MRLSRIQELFEKWLFMRYRWGFIYSSTLLEELHTGGRLWSGSIALQASYIGHIS